MAYQLQVIGPASVSNVVFLSILAVVLPSSFLLAVVLGSTLAVVSVAW